MEKEAFIQIIEEHKKLIYKLLHSFCPDQESMKDLEQEILLQLWMSIESFNGQAKLSTWIYRVALNTCLLFSKKQHKRLSKYQPLNESVFSISDADNAAVDEDRLSMMWQMIYQLKAIDRAIILLYLEGMKYREISEIMGISESNVATRINRIKASMRNHLKSLQM